MLDGQVAADLTYFLTYLLTYLLTMLDGQVAADPPARLQLLSAEEVLNALRLRRHRLRIRLTLPSSPRVGHGRRDDGACAPGLLQAVHDLLRPRLHARFGETVRVALCNRSEEEPHSSEEEPPDGVRAEGCIQGGAEEEARDGDVRGGGCRAAPSLRIGSSLVISEACVSEATTGHAPTATSTVPTSSQVGGGAQRLVCEWDSTDDALAGACIEVLMRPDEP